MAIKFLDLEENPAVLVGVHYDTKERHYYIVEDWLFRHRSGAPRFRCTKAHVKGIMNRPCSYARMESAIKNARLYCDLNFAYKFVGFVPDYLLYGYEGSLLNMGKAFVIGHRRYRGEAYALKVRDEDGLSISSPQTVVTCLTPENAFGYKDTLLLTRDGKLRQLHRNDVPEWIRRDLKPHMELVRKAGCFYG